MCNNSIPMKIEKVEIENGEFEIIDQLVEDNLLRIRLEISLEYH